MTREDIDKLFEAVNNEQFELVFEYVENKDLVNKTIQCIANNDEGLNELVSQCFKIIKDKIVESNEYEYFIETGLKNENQEILVSFAEHTGITADEAREWYSNVDYIDGIRLIKATKDIDYIKKCVEDSSLEISKESRIELIIETGDKDYIKKSIKDNSLDLDSRQITKLITATSDKDFIKECLTDSSLDLEFTNQMQLLVACKDGEELKECFIEKEDKISSQDKIDLPKGMTIGIEIEADGMEQRKGLFDGWEAKRDGSIPKGLEIVSPILSGNEKDSENIYTICNMLKETGCKATEQCGGHVHIGANYLTTKESYMNLIELWSNTEKILYTISNDGGDITRNSGITYYAEPLSGKVEKALENGTINLENEGELSEFVSQIKNVQGKRYSGLNFLNITENGKNTIEFRLANGTVNPKIWIENINLFGGIIKASERLEQIKNKDENDRSSEEQEYLEQFEKIKDKETEEIEKLDALLNLTVSKDKKDVYKKRYELNNEILNDNPDKKEAINTRVAKKIIAVKDIGKRTLTGLEAVNGVEMQNAENRFENDRSSQRDMQQTINQEK